MHDYNSQVHNEKGTSPLNVGLPIELPSAVTIGQWTGTASKVLRDIQSHRTDQRPVEDGEPVKEAVGRFMKATIRRYKHSYDKKVTQESQICKADEVSFERPNHAAFLPFCPRAYLERILKTDETYRMTLYGSWKSVTHSHQQWRLHFKHSRDWQRASSTKLTEDTQEVINAEPVTMADRHPTRRQQWRISLGILGSHQLVSYLKVERAIRIKLIRLRPAGRQRGTSCTHSSTFYLSILESHK